MHDINVTLLNLIDRDLSNLIDRHRAMMAAPADNLPLAASIEVLAEIVRQGGNQPFAIRIPDDPRLRAVWHQADTAALVATYWRHKLAHIDLVIAADASLIQPWLVGVGFADEELVVIRTRPCPLLVRCRVRQRVPTIAEILGMIAYMPAMLTAFGID